MALQLLAQGSSISELNLLGEPLPRGSAAELRVYLGDSASGETISGLESALCVSGIQLRCPIQQAAGIISVKWEVKEGQLGAIATCVSESLGEELPWQLFTESPSVGWVIPATLFAGVLLLGRYQRASR